MQVIRHSVRACAQGGGTERTGLPPVEVGRYLLVFGASLLSASPPLPCVSLPGANRPSPLTSPDRAPPPGCSAVQQHHIKWRHASQAVRGAPCQERQHAFPGRSERQSRAPGWLAPAPAPARRLAALAALAVLAMLTTLAALTALAARRKRRSQ
jgi:hypothetical protein